MAIRRCPYCKAIVEEDGEYCSNCGTRLLFPEDEEIEEEIPGEKIIEDEEEKQRDIDEEEEGIEEEEEEIDIEKEEDEDRDGEEDIEDLNEEEKLEGEKGEEENSIKETKGLPEEELTEEKESEEPVLKTEDLQKAMDSSEKEKEEIETFLDSLKKERQQIKDKIEEVEGEIPPWAETIKDEDAKEKTGEEEQEFVQDSFEGLEAEEEEEDEEIMEEEVTASEEPEEEQEPVDTDEQEDLPFYEGEALRDKKEPLKLFKKPSIKISAWIKSRMFDVLFIAGLWFVTLWIASYLTSVTVFQLISNSTLAVIVFFIILLSVYLFCFLFFLGETIGDYVFPKNDS
ncbi:MAG: zinc ribbon domain-containing protein [Candidatus Aminicenantes bacterium]|nr:zinc ribbon domain-containing protein [Candidatus Aminicenantes bacterium]